jgi:hypothetical protein
MIVTFKCEDFDREEVGATKLRSADYKPMELRVFGSPDPTLIEDFGWQKKSRAIEIAKEYGAKFVVM